MALDAKVVVQAKGWRLLRSQAFQDRLIAYGALIPTALLLLVLVVFPLLSVLRLAFYEKGIMDIEASFVGFANYSRLLADPGFHNALKNSLIWVGSNVVAELAIGLAVALALHQRLWLRSLWRGLVLFPYLLPTIVAVLVWKFMLHDVLGVVTYWVRAIPYVGGNVSWFGAPGWAMVAVVLVGVWKFFPFVVIALLGILQSIPAELYESARVDGASRWQQFRYITWPSILPVFLLTGLLRTFWTFDKFDIIYLLTGGGPADSTMTLPLLVYRQAFADWSMGQAAATASVMFVILAAIGGLYLKLYSKGEGAF